MNYEEEVRPSEYFPGIPNPDEEPPEKDPDEEERRKKELAEKIAKW